jgi:hypothetical protein
VTTGDAAIRRISEAGPRHRVAIESRRMDLFAEPGKVSRIAT